MPEADLRPFTRRRIAGLADEVLRQSETVGVLPTPLAEVQAALGVEERLDMRRLPKALARKKPRAWSRILGAFWHEERVVFIDEEQVESRRHWTDGHEAAHAMCGWHAEILRLDNESTLFKSLKAGIEAEANYGAGRLIFQGDRFHRRALRDQISMRTPIELAKPYGASRHATLHYYVEEHPYAVALLIAGRYPYVDGSLPIWRSVESMTFRSRYGSLPAHLPGGRLSLGDGPDAPLGQILRESRLATDPPSTLVQIPDRRGTPRKFVAEAFFNQHCQFIFVAERKATLLGKRVRLESPPPLIANAR